MIIYLVFWPDNNDQGVVASIFHHGLTLFSIISFFHSIDKKKILYIRIFQHIGLYQGGFSLFLSIIVESFSFLTNPLTKLKRSHRQKLKKWRFFQCVNIEILTDSFLEYFRTFSIVTRHRAGISKSNNCLFRVPKKNILLKFQIIFS